MDHWLRSLGFHGVDLNDEPRVALVQIGSTNRLELSEQNELMTRDEPVEES